MPSEQADYQKLYRLRQKAKRLQKRISLLESRLSGRKHRWGGCALKKKRR